MTASVFMAIYGMVHNASLTVQSSTTLMVLIMEQKPVTVIIVTYGTIVSKNVGSNVNY
jgi:hypothetical protein